MKDLITRSAAAAFIFAVSAPAALAQNYLGDIGNAIETGGGSTTDLPTIIAGIINTLLGFLGVVALVLVIISGFQWMMAGGDSSKVDTAKTRMINGVIGLAIILAAYSITTFVFSALSGATGANIQ